MSGSSTTRTNERQSGSQQRRGGGGRRTAATVGAVVADTGVAKTTYCPKGKCFDYKDLDTLSRYINESGKIKPRRQTGNCSRCQRELSREIKRRATWLCCPLLLPDKQPRPFICRWLCLPALGRIG